MFMPIVTGITVFLFIVAGFFVAVVEHERKSAKSTRLRKRRAARNRIRWEYVFEETKLVKAQ